MLDPTMLEPFLTSFFGYGNLAGPVWFIGMEEGGGATENEITARLQAWESRGRRQVEDVRDFHLAASEIQATQLLHPQEQLITICLASPFAQEAALQSTWARLMRTVFAARGIAATREVMRDYQINGFARATDSIAVLEFLPLPSPKSRLWNYGPVRPRVKDATKTYPATPWTDIPYLQSRGSYRQRLLAERTARLAEMMRQHKPRAVIFYGESLRSDWIGLGGVNFAPRDYSLHGGTAEPYFMLLPHPAAWRTPSRGSPALPATELLFQQAGEALRARGIEL